MPNGNWEVDERNWTADTEGNLYSLGHYVLTESATGDVVDDIALPVGEANDPKELALWGAKVAEWEELVSNPCTLRPCSGTR